MVRQCDMDNILFYIPAGILVLFIGFVFGWLINKRVSASHLKHTQKLAENIIAEAQREAETQKVPVMLVVGDQEETDGTVTPRWRRDAQRTAEAIPVDAFVAGLSEQIAHRRG